MRTATVPPIQTHRLRVPFAALAAAAALTAAAGTAHAAAPAKAAAAGVNIECSGSRAVVNFSPGLKASTPQDIMVSLGEEMQLTCTDNSTYPDPDSAAKVTGGKVTAITGNFKNSTCAEMNGAVDISITWDLSDSTHPTSILRIGLGGDEKQNAGTGKVTSGQFEGATFTGTDLDPSATDFDACGTDSGLTTATTSMTGTLSSS